MGYGNSYSQCNRSHSACIAEAGRTADFSAVDFLRAAIFPLVGVSAYILFGINTADHKGWEKQHSDIRFNRILYRFREPTDPLELANRCKRSHKVHPKPENLMILNRIFDRTGPYHPLLGRQQHCITRRRGSSAGRDVHSNRKCPEKTSTCAHTYFRMMRSGDVSWKH